MGGHARALRRAAWVCLAAAVLGAGSPLFRVPAYAAGSLPISPMQGLAGTSITVRPDFKNESTCQLMWDGTVTTDSFDCGGTSPGTTQQALGAPGTHTVTVCEGVCDSVDAVPTEVADFVVQTTVPDLTKRPLDGSGGAFELLKNADLAVGSESGPVRAPGAVVVNQDPSRGSVVDPQRPVDIIVAVPGPSISTSTPAARPPHRVVVPDVRTLRVRDARRELAATKLKLEVASPHSAGTVSSQEPRPGTLVPRGSTVHVTLASAALAPPPPPSRGGSPAVPASLIIAVSIAALLAAACLAVWLVRRPHLRVRARTRPPPPVRPRVVRTVLTGDVSVQATGKPLAPTVEFRCTRESSVEVRS